MEGRGQSARAPRLIQPQASIQGPNAGVHRQVERPVKEKNNKKTIDCYICKVKVQTVNLFPDLNATLA